MRFKHGYLLANRDLQQKCFPPLDSELLPDPIRLTITETLNAHTSGRGLRDRDYQRVFGFVRKTRAAFFEYEAARADYADFWTGAGKDRYLLDALSHFESLIAFIVQAHELLFGLRRTDWRDRNVEGRLQTNEKIYQIYNSAKHMDGSLRRNPSKTEDVRLPFISNEGLTNGREAVNFVEFHSVMLDMCEASECMCRSDNRAYAKKMASKLGLSS